MTKAQVQQLANLHNKGLCPLQTPINNKGHAPYLYSRGHPSPLSRKHML